MTTERAGQSSSDEVVRLRDFVTELAAANGRYRVARGK